MLLAFKVIHVHTRTRQIQGIISWIDVVKYNRALIQPCPQKTATVSFLLLASSLLTHSSTPFISRADGRIALPLSLKTANSHDAYK
jgi:hypothetical protein